MTEQMKSKLRFGTALHGTILDALRSRYTLSTEGSSNRHEKWKKDEERFTAYIKESDSDMLRREVRESEGIPQQTTIILPYTYAIVMTMHTYLTSVYLSRDPILQYEGRHGEPEMRKTAVEALIQYNVRSGKAMVPWYIHLMDVCRYGVGVTGVFWDREEYTVTTEVEEPVKFLGMPVPGRFETRVVEEEIVGYEGNRVYNIRPYNAHFDPRVSLVNYQKGEFVCVESDEKSYLDIQTSRNYFNKDVALKTRRESNQPAGSERFVLPDGNEEITEPVDIANIGTGNMKEYYVRLVAKDWKLGPAEHSEVWVFSVWNDRVIVEARPTGDYHGRFPVLVQEYEIDGYQLSKRSVGEVIGPMQELLDWLVNTHLYNVRKSLNDVLLVDPSLVTMKDLLEPGPGKLVRMRPRGYGSGMIDKAVHQLQVQTVTGTHMQDTGLIAEMMQRASGVTDQVMGMLEPRGRRTAAEVRTNTAFGVNRLKTVGEWGSAQYWQDVAEMMLQNCQQYYDAEMKLRLAGDSVSMRGAEKFLMVSPQDIAGRFDFVPVDGTLPVDRYAQANLWREMLGTMAQVPGVLEQYDMGSLFGWVAQLAGLKGIKQFKLELTDDQVLLSQMQQGNVVPIGAKGGQATGGPAGGGEVGEGSLAEPGQVSGLGTTA